MSESFISPTAAPRAGRFKVGATPLADITNRGKPVRSGVKKAAEERLLHPSPPSTARPEQPSYVRHRTHSASHPEVEAALNSHADTCDTAPAAAAGPYEDAAQDVEHARVEAGPCAAESPMVIREQDGPAVDSADASTGSEKHTEAMTEDAVVAAFAVDSDAIATSHTKVKVRGHALELHATLPRPPALPDLDSMSVSEMIREVVAVGCQREAETLAASRKLTTVPTVFSRGHDDAGTPSRSEAHVGQAAEVAHGTMHVSTYNEGSNAGPVIESYRVVVGAASGTEEPVATRCGGMVLGVQLVEQEIDVVVDASGACEHPPPIMRLILHSSEQLQLTTLAYCVPRPGVETALPSELYAGGCDAVSVLKQLMAAAVPAGTSAASALEQCGVALQTTKHQAQQAPLQLLRSFCRVWPHAALTPAQSEARVQDLVRQIKLQTGYDMTMPPAPLAQTRLGTTHTRIDANAALSSTTDCALVSPQHSHGNSRSAHTVDFGCATPVRTPARTSKQRAADGIGMTPSKMTPVVLHSQRKHRPVITFNLSLTGSRTPKSSARRRSSTGLGLNDSMMASPAPRALARFVSSIDLTRPGKSPASFDRDDHKTALATLQMGLDAMVTQRRAEEEHMRRITRVRPGRSPNGGYMYTDIDTGLLVSPHDYESVYLAEVQYAMEYINAATTLAWEREAEMKAAAMAEWSPDTAARETAAFAAYKAARISWWDQDIEEGIEANGLVAGVVSSATEDRKEMTVAESERPYAALAGDQTELPHSSAGALIASLVRNWIVAECAAWRDGALETVLMQRQVTGEACSVVDGTPRSAQPSPMASSLQSSCLSTTLRSCMPFALLAPIVTAGSDAVQRAVDAVLSAAGEARLSETARESAAAQLWTRIAEAVAEYAVAQGVRVMLPSQLELQDVRADHLTSVEQHFSASSNTVCESNGTECLSEAHLNGAGPETATFVLSTTGDIQLQSMLESITGAETHGFDLPAGVMDGVPEILSDALHALPQPGTESSDMHQEETPFDGITMQLLPVELAAEHLDALDASASKCGASFEDAASAGDDAFDDSLMAALSQAAPLVSQYLGNSAGTVEDATRLLLDEAVIPAPHEDRSPSPVDDDEHVPENVTEAGATAVETVTAPGCTTGSTALDSIPIPARFGPFSPRAARNPYMSPSGIPSRTASAKKSTGNADIACADMEPGNAAGRTPVAPTATFFERATAVLLASENEAGDVFGAATSMSTTMTMSNDELFAFASSSIMSEQGIREEPSWREEEDDTEYAPAGDVFGLFAASPVVPAGAPQPGRPSVIVRRARALGLSPSMFGSAATGDRREAAVPSPKIARPPPRPLPPTEA